MAVSRVHELNLKLPTEEAASVQPLANSYIRCAEFFFKCTCSDAKVSDGNVPFFVFYFPKNCDDTTSR